MRGDPNCRRTQIKKLADGRIYSGEQAKASGLVDDIGYLEDAIDTAKKKAGSHGCEGGDLSAGR